jgi:hypothetical protein
MLDHEIGKTLPVDQDYTLRQVAALRRPSFLSPKCEISLNIGFRTTERAITVTSLVKTNDFGRSLAAA